MNQRSRHIDIKYHFVRDLQAKKKIDVQYCPTEEMLADFFTKPMAKKQFEDFRSRLHIVNDIG